MSEISVIVPVYKVEPFLSRCIKSILNQTYSDFNLVLIDDGSPDKCGAICEEFARADSRIHVIHQANKGLSSARNSGIEWVLVNSSSEWITFVDSDDWLHPKYLEVLYNSAVRDNTKIVIGGALWTNNDCLPEIINETSITWKPEDYFLKDATNATVSWGKLYSKALFKKIRFPEGKIHEDEFTTYKIVDRCEKISLVDGVFYHHMLRSGSITQSPYSVKNLDAVEAFYLKYLYFKEKGDDYRRLQLMAGDVFAGLYYRSKEYFHPSTEKEKSRVYEIDKMARNICLDSFRHWSTPRRVKLLAPGLYLFLSKYRRKWFKQKNN